MREVSLFSGTTKPRLSFSKDLDHQKALDKMGDIDRSSTSRKTPWLLQNKTMWLKVSVKENEVPTEKYSSRASIFATKASYISN